MSTNRWFRFLVARVFLSLSLIIALPPQVWGQFNSEEPAKAIASQSAKIGLLGVTVLTSNETGAGGVPYEVRAEAIHMMSFGMVPSCCTGDFDNNNVVTIVDVPDFVSALLAGPACPALPACCQGDINSDGVVNGGDISGFIVNLLAGGACAPASVNLRSLSTFAAVAGAGLINSNSAGQTTINGNVGLSPTETCLGDGVPCSALNPVINGTLYANDPEGIAATAKADLMLAYNDAAGRPPGTTISDLSGMVLAPGVYTSGSTMDIGVGGELILDAQGDANAVWIFQVGSSLTVNNSAQVVLINGAQAANVFWAVFASSTLGTGVSFSGTVLAGASNSMSTGTTVEGRIFCMTGQITLLSNTLTTPSP